MACFCAAILPKNFAAISKCLLHVLARWHREAEREPSLREVLERMVEYRRHVLAIFDSLIGFDTRITRLQ